MRQDTTMLAGHNQQFAEELAHRLAEIGDVNVKRFFGGFSLTHGGVQFAMVMKGTVYFHVNDTTRSKYQAHQSQAFHYVSKSKDIIVNRYFEVPVAPLESDVELVAWARESILTVKIKSPARSKSLKKIKNEVPNEF